MSWWWNKTVYEMIFIANIPFIPVMVSIAICYCLGHTLIFLFGMHEIFAAILVFVFFVSALSTFCIVFDIINHYAEDDW